jgi:hypothetical protein
MIVPEPTDARPQVMGSPEYFGEAGEVIRLTPTFRAPNR